MTPDKNAALVGWTDDQWNLVLTTVTTEAQKARLAASFLPVTGPLDPMTVAVPNLKLAREGTPDNVAVGDRPPPERLLVDSQPNLKLITISTFAYLHSHEVADPDLAAALGIFRRAANMIARAEDAIIFNGKKTVLKSPLDVLVRIPPPAELEKVWDGLAAIGNETPVGEVSSDTVFTAVVGAIGTLEDQGYFGPFACVLSKELFAEASRPIAALVSARDRLLPFLDGLLFRSGLLPKNSGIVVALGGAPVEIVVASDISVNFLQINTEPRWVFRVSERIALRVKDVNAVQRLTPLTTSPA
jgi:uncharacterized linocin/CFP29 family protein